MKRIEWTVAIALGTVFACLHFAVTFISFLGTLFGALGAKSGDVWMVIFVIASFPGHVLIGSPAGPDTSQNALLLALFAANSAVWGIAFVLLIRWIRGRRHAGR